MKSYAPRKPRHRLASLGNPKKKKSSLLFYFRGGGFFLKWKGLFSFWDSALQVFGQCGGASIRTRFCENYFLGILIFAKPRLICFWILSARRRGLGRNPRGLLFRFFLRQLQKTKKSAKIQILWNLPEILNILIKIMLLLPEARVLRLAK